MKKNILILAALFLAATHIFGQAPEAISFQAVARDTDGKLIKNQQITLKVNVVKGQVNADSIYTEYHSKMTSDNGVINFLIGKGYDRDGDFDDIDWGSDAHFLDLKIDVANIGSFKDLATVPFVSVPYALHSRTAEFVENVDDADADDRNELINDFSLDTNDKILHIQEGDEPVRSVNLSPLFGNAQSDNWGDQVVESDATLAGEGTAGIPLTLARQGANTGQVLKWSGNSWTPADDEEGSNSTNTDNQQIEEFDLDGTSHLLTLSIEDGGTASVNLGILQDGVEDDDADTTNELQRITLVSGLNSSQRTLHILDGSGDVYDTETFDVKDADHDVYNELVTDFDYNSATKKFTISEGSNTISRTVDFGSNHWDKSGNNIYYQDGNVGVGTNNPTSKIEVHGEAFNGTNAVLEIEDDANQEMWIDGNSIDTKNDLNLNANRPGDVTLALGGGSVGIGDQSDNARLQVTDNTGGIPLKVRSRTQGTSLPQEEMRITGSSADAMQSPLWLNRSSQTDVYIAKGGGRLGLGSSNLGYDCEMVCGSFIIKSNDGNSANALKIETNWVNGLIGLYTNGAYNPQNPNNGWKNGLWLREGKVGINTTAPTKALTVNGGVEVHDGVTMDEMFIQQNGSTKIRLQTNDEAGRVLGYGPNNKLNYSLGYKESTYPNLGQLILYGTFGNSTGTSGGLAKYPVRMYAWNDNKGYIHADVISQWSDKRIKKDIIGFKDALRKVLELRGVRYNMKDDSTALSSAPKEVGLIAQEVEMVIPELVSCEDNGLRSMNYAKLTAVLIEAIKEQQAMIDELKDEKTGLKVQFDRLNAQVQALQAALPDLLSAND